jgi:hypothetical protein
MNPKLKPPTRSNPSSRRVSSPSCRGGASSLLRLSRSDSTRLPSVEHLSGWVQRAAALFNASTRPPPPAFGVSEYGVGSTG